MKKCKKKQHLMLAFYTKSKFSQSPSNVNLILIYASITFDEQSIGANAIFFSKEFLSSKNKNFIKIIIKINVNAEEKKKWNQKKIFHRTKKQQKCSMSGMRID